MYSIYKKDREELACNNSLIIANDIQNGLVEVLGVGHSTDLHSLLIHMHITTIRI